MNQWTMRARRFPLTPDTKNPRVQLGRYGVALKLGRYAYIAWWHHS